MLAQNFYSDIVDHRTPGRHRILEGFCPDKAMLETSARELVEERRGAFEIPRGSRLWVEPYRQV